MSQTNRRQFLKTSAMGVGVAVGTGSAYADDKPQFSTSSVVKTFTATAGEGYIAIDADNPQGDGSDIGRVDFAGDQIDGDVTISGEVYDDNTWKSTSVNFPPIDIENFLSEDTFSDLPIDIGLDDIDADIQVNVPQITGQFDTEQELVTAEPFEVEVDADATVDAGITSIDIAIVVSASADLTTGQSGELEGGVQNGLDPQSATVTLVSNDFIVPATGETISVPVVGDIDVDDQVGLPADDPSRNYLELELDMNIAEIFGTVDGRVTDRGGVGLSDVRVEFRTGGSVVTTATTGTDGSYSVNLQPGSYSITFDDPRYERDSREMQVAEDTTTTVNATLTELDFGTVFGTVRDAQDNTLDGVEVVVENTVTNEAVATVVTDADGKFSTEIVAAGDTHEVSASEAGFGEDRALVSANTDGETVTASLQLGDPPDPGTVYGALTGLPVELDPPQNGVIALTDPQSGDLIREVSANNMSFEFDVPPGEYGIAFSADGFTEYADTVTVPESGLMEYNIPLDVKLPPVVGGRPPKDIDGDNTYENVRGSNEFTILDVQALFTELESPAVQDNAWAYNFSGSDETKVTILDVQALFNKLKGQ